MSERTYTELKKMTHGEKYFYYKENIDFSKTTDEISRTFSNLPRRMGRSAAMKYYSKKIRDYFDSKLTIRDFTRVEDYYDYFEARRHLNATEKIRAA